MNRLGCTDSGVAISGTDLGKGFHDVFEIVILALGFGLEEESRNRTSSYWDNDNFGRFESTGNSRKSYLVSGCGDGGLIDAARLCVGIDQSELTQLVLNWVTSDCMDELVQIEQKARQFEAANRVQLQASFKNKSMLERAVAHAVSQFLETQYSKMSIPMLVAALNQFVRTDAEVVLNGSSPTPFSFRSSIFNRLVTTALFDSRAALSYRGGRISEKARPDGIYELSDGSHSFENIDEVVFRHGPKSVMGRLLSSRECYALSEVVAPVAEALSCRQYPQTFLEGNLVDNLKRQTFTVIAAQNLSTVVQEFQSSQGSYTVQNKGNEVEYLVKANSPEKMTKVASVFGVRVRFEADQFASFSVTTFGQRLRPGSTIGFKRANTWELAVITCVALHKAHGIVLLSLASSDVAASDRFFHPPNSEKAIEGKVVEHAGFFPTNLETFGAVLSGSQNIAIATLLSCPIGAQCDNVLNLAPTLKMPHAVRAVANPTPNLRVFTIHDTDFQFGRIVSIGDRVGLSMPSQCDFSDVFVVEPQKDYFASLDSRGAPVMDSQGRLVGLVLGEKAGMCYCLPIRNATDRFAITL